MDICTHYGLTLKGSALGILITSAFIPDGLFTIMLPLGLFERRRVAPSDYQETVHAH